MNFRTNQDPQSISLTNKTSVYPNLVVPPHSGEKLMNKVREAGKVINKGHHAQWRLTSWCHTWLSRLSPVFLCLNTVGRTKDNAIIHEKTMVCCSLQTSTSNPYSRGTSQQTVPSSKCDKMWQKVTFVTVTHSNLRREAGRCVSHKEKILVVFF